MFCFCPLVSCFQRENIVELIVPAYPEIEYTFLAERNRQSVLEDFGDAGAMSGVIFL